MPFTQRKLLSLGQWKPFLAATMVGVLLGFTGPFGSYPAFSPTTRYAFWMGMTAAGALAAVATEATLPLKWFYHGPMRNGVVAIVSALPMTFVVAWTMSFLQAGRFFEPQQLPALFGAVAAIQLLVAFVMKMAAPISVQGYDSSTAAATPDSGTAMSPVTFPSALLNKLPPEISQGIIALETEDHYLRVHANGGSALILMRMADAVAMIDPLIGAQVHRRWWVAHTAVEELHTDGSRLFLCLRDNIRVPVGRTFATSVRARFKRAANI